MVGNSSANLSRFLPKKEFRDPTTELISLLCFNFYIELTFFYDRYGRNGWLGLASIGGISNCVIGNASSRLNDSYLLDTARYSQTAINHVACQEVGHTFGLNHNRSSSTTCMNDTILTAGNQINQHDRDLLAQIYANIP